MRRAPAGLAGSALLIWAGLSAPPSAARWALADPPPKPATQALKLAEVDQLRHQNALLRLDAAMRRLPEWEALRQIEQDILARYKIDPAKGDKFDSAAGTILRAPRKAEGK